MINLITLNNLIDKVLAPSQRTRLDVVQLNETWVTYSNIQTSSKPTQIANIQLEAYITIGFTAASLKVFIRQSSTT